MNIKQRSSEWLELRKTKITSTDSPIIMGSNKWRSKKDLMQEKLGMIDPQPINEKMQRGIDLEPKAMELFYEMTGLFMLPQVVINDFMMSSLDGISLDGQTIVEIKSPNKATHKMAKNGNVPPYYYDQCMHHLAVTGLPMIYYFSFDGKNDGAIVEIKRDEKYIVEMIEKEKEFYQALLMFVDEKDLNKYYNPKV